MVSQSPKVDLVVSVLFCGDPTQTHIRVRFDMEEDLVDYSKDSHEGMLIWSTPSKWTHHQGSSQVQRLYVQDDHPDIIKHVGELLCSMDKGVPTLSLNALDILSNEGISHSASAISPPILSHVDSIHCSSRDVRSTSKSVEGSHPMEKENTLKPQRTPLMENS